MAIPTNEPPTQFYREGTQDMTGTNPDIARLLGQALGVKVEIQVANFDSIIPGDCRGPVRHDRLLDDPHGKAHGGPGFR